MVYEINSYSISQNYVQPIGFLQILILFIICTARDLCHIKNRCGAFSYVWCWAERKNHGTKIISQFHESEMREMWKMWITCQAYVLSRRMVSFSRYSLWNLRADGLPYSLEPYYLVDAIPVAIGWSKSKYKHLFGFLVIFVFFFLPLHYDNLPPCNIF